MSGTSDAWVHVRILESHVRKYADTSLRLQGDPALFELLLLFIHGVAFSVTVRLSAAISWNER